ncbi:hypothetical protein TEA_002265 [Camellia sinensis var. sinensis]|uniref:Methionyl-tRNA synthetase anticodon-binding domain-containing protein n=1 Tax=Camellia sinensis var. sinensis TaxID=542762 RepID=A0A4S4EBC5_CAMSN|nr:hypothetical protein TEA_002265 [Camellia sinensis var. sinensis]
MSNILALEESKGVGYHSIIPDALGAESHPLTKAFGEKVGDYVVQYFEAMEKDQLSCSVVMKTSAGLVYLLACLLEPFMPSFSIEVFKQLNLPPEMQVLLSDENGDIERAKRPWEFLPAGHKIGIPEPLFKELKDEEVEFFRQKFLTIFYVSLATNMEVNDLTFILFSGSDENGDIERAKRRCGFLPAGHKIGIPEPLFKELKDEEVEFFRQKFLTFFYVSLATNMEVYKLWWTYGPPPAS